MSGTDNLDNLIIKLPPIINQYVGNLLIFILYHCVPPSPSHTLNKLSYLLFTQKKGG